MQAYANRFPNGLIWIAGIAVTVFCAAGTAALMGWIPSSMGHSNDNAVAPLPLDKPLPNAAGPASKSHVIAAPHKAAVAGVNPLPAHAACADCGVIESTREVEAKGEGSGLGAVGGAVVGGLLGTQVGGGRGKELATVVGALGGGLAGNEIEKRVKTARGYDTTVRLADGSSRVVHASVAPMWRAGDHVRVVDGVLQSN